MKNLILKNAKKWLLFSCGIFAVLALAFFAIPTVKADASVMSAPQLKRGASIRIIKNDYAENGLRFTMLFSQSDYNVLSEKTTVTEGVAAEITDLKFGMLIVPEAYNLAGNDQEIISLLKGQSDKYYIGEKPESVSDTAKQILDISANGLGALNLVENDDEICYAYNAAIIDLKQKNITLNFVGIGYYAYNAIGESGETELNIVLASYQNGDMSNNVRSMAQVAYTAIEKGDENAEWLNECYIQKTAITVKFDTDGGSVIETQTVKYGETVVKPSDPQKEGVVFSRWELNGEPYDFSSPVKQNVTLKAVYKPEEIIPEGTVVLNNYAEETSLWHKTDWGSKTGYYEWLEVYDGVSGIVKFGNSDGGETYNHFALNITNVDLTKYSKIVVRLKVDPAKCRFVWIYLGSSAKEIDVLEAGKTHPSGWLEIRIPIASMLELSTAQTAEEFHIRYGTLKGSAAGDCVWIDGIYGDITYVPEEVIPEGSTALNQYTEKTSLWHRTNWGSSGGYSEWLEVYDGVRGVVKFGNSDGGETYNHFALNITNVDLTKYSEIVVRLKVDPAKCRFVWIWLGSSGKEIDVLEAGKTHPSGWLEIRIPVASMLELSTAQTAEEFHIQYGTLKGSAAGDCVWLDGVYAIENANA